MNAESIAQSRALGGVAVGLAALLAAVGIQQIARRASAADPVVLAPLFVTLGVATIVVVAGRGTAGARRTPYW